MYSMVIAQSLSGCIVVMEFEKRRVMPITISYVLLSTFIFVFFPLAHWFSAAFSAGLLSALCLLALIDRKFNYAILFVFLGPQSLCPGARFGWRSILAAPLEA